MDRRELEIMLNEAFDRGIVSVGHLVHETVEVGFLNELGRTVGFTLNGWKEAIETIPVDLFDSFDDGRGREWFLSDCKALGGKVPQNTYRGELVSALADVLMVEEAAPALGALESALDSARRKGYCVFDRGVHGDVPADGLVYLCSTYPAAVGLKDSLDSIRAQGNDPDTRTLGVYRMVDGYCIMGGLDSGSQADAYAVDADLAEGWGVGDAAFRIADLKAKTFSYAVEAGEAQGASTLVYYTDEGADPVLFQQTDGDWRLASDNFLAENAIVEDLEQAYTGEISPVYLNRDIVDMEEMAEAHGEGVAAGIKAQAEAYNGMDNPYLLANRYIDIMPKVAEQVAKPLTAVDSIKMYGSGNAQKLVKETTSIVDQVASGLKDSTGIDLPSLLNGLISNPDIDADSAENSVE